MDPLPHKRPRPDWSDLVSGLIDSLVQTASAMMAVKATKAAAQPPASPPPASPPSEPPPSRPAQQPPDADPLAVLVAEVNQAVAAKEEPINVAGKIAALVHVAREFGRTGKHKDLLTLLENPEEFLKHAYPEAEKEYLEQIARTLVEMLPLDGEPKEHP